MKKDFQENDFSRRSKKYRTRYLDELGKLYGEAKKAHIEPQVEFKSDPLPLCQPK
jgi:hypothetical protein